MPIQPTYPGVYIEEIPSGVRTITGVSTSIAAFIGYFKKGPVNTAVHIFSFGDFERVFGGLDSSSEAGYAIQQFFLNGGTQAHVVRVASGSLNAANATLDTEPGDNTEVMRFRAIHEGTWGNNIRLKIDHKASGINEFNMVVTEYSDSGTVINQETWLNLTRTPGESNFVTTVINDENSGSQLVRVDTTVAAGVPPAANGTISGEHVDPAVVALSAPVAFQAEVNGAAAGSVLLQASAGNYSLAQLAPILEDAIRAADPTNKILSGATVGVMGNRLQILAGQGPADTLISFSGPAPTVAELLIEDGVSAVGPNLQEYILGLNALGANTNGTTAQLDSSGADPEAGSNGTVPDSAAIIGSLNLKTGIYALEDVDLFNIMCIPRTGMASNNTYDAAISAALAYCEEKRAFFILETPVDIDTMQEVKNWKDTKGSLIRSTNAALYFPRVLIPDALNDFRLRSVGASGTVAGLYARTDTNRGVWKAPAGTEATLKGVSQLEYVLSDRENGVLNPLAINSLRNFPVYGNICWGARTMEGADALASEWKYVPVRRLALFLEESLFRGSQWVVFEPNDEPLWAQIRLNVGAFMNNLFKQGAFQGSSPKDAYLVKCDSETTTQNDINLGIVNIVVGFAPLKPAEFVFIKIQQLTGQIDT